MKITGEHRITGQWPPIDTGFGEGEDKAIGVGSLQEPTPELQLVLFVLRALFVTLYSTRTEINLQGLIYMFIANTINQIE